MFWNKDYKFENVLLLRNEVSNSLLFIASSMITGCLSFTPFRGLIIKANQRN